MVLLIEFISRIAIETVPICMPSEVSDVTGRMATVTGWGRLKYNGGVPSVLQEVQVSVRVVRLPEDLIRKRFRHSPHSLRRS